MSFSGWTFPPIHKEGYRFIAIFAVVTLLLFGMSSFLGWIGVILTLWCVAFFRDPDRVGPTTADVVIAPADGTVCAVDEVPPPAELEMGDEPVARVGIFMNVFNVHVNRAPAQGIIGRIAYRPGLFLNASTDKSSTDNERCAYRLDLDDGRSLAFTQIAGLVARRIVWYVEEGDEIGRGERFGLIRFGSRMDVYFPKGVTPIVEIGQTMLAGETVLASLNTAEHPPIPLPDASTDTSDA